jgi:hypothetical protein
MNRLNENPDLKSLHPIHIQEYVDCHPEVMNSFLELTSSDGDRVCIMISEAAEEIDVSLN